MTLAEPIIVYTCVAGLYDRELMAASNEKGIRFVCFSDTPNRIKAPGWEMRKFESPARLTNGHDINRFHKIFAHRLFPEHRWSIYLDGNVRYSGQFADLVHRLRESRKPLGAFWHRNGHTLATEIEACRKIKFDRRDVDVICAQMDQYEAAGIGIDEKIPTNNLIVRDHQSSELSDAMSIWWSHLFEFTKRDQISLLYALATTGTSWQPLDSEHNDKGGIDTNLVETIWHKPPIGMRIERRLRKQFGLARKG